MSNWKSRRSTFIPDMHPPKKYECKVCGCQFIAKERLRAVDCEETDGKAD